MRKGLIVGYSWQQSKNLHGGIVIVEAINASQLSWHTLHQLNSDLSTAMKGDVVFVSSPIFPPLDNEFRVAIDEIRERSSKTHLVVMLETNGGQMEIVERLVSVMRSHYKTVSFVIPDFAYSAGTVLALSGDRIYMDYYSVLGPIDPQYRGSDGNYHSGYGVLAKYKELVEKINQTTSRENVKAEFAILLKNFDQAQIFHIEQAIEHGIALITEWLPQYKFKSWAATETRGLKVTRKMKEERAKDIAGTLGNAAKWHSHGRGIPMHRLESDELNSLSDLGGSLLRRWETGPFFRLFSSNSPTIILKKAKNSPRFPTRLATAPQVRQAVKLVIDDFGAESGLNSLIRNYHGLAVDHFSKAGMREFVHSEFGVRRTA